MLNSITECWNGAWNGDCCSSIYRKKFKGWWEL